MKKTISIVVACLMTASSFAQNKADWENPEVFAINKENTRATALPYATMAQAAMDDYKSSPYYKSLNGNWQFYWVEKIADVPEKFYAEDYNTTTAVGLKIGTPNQISGKSGWVHFKLSHLSCVFNFSFCQYNNFIPIVIFPNNS